MSDPTGEIAEFLYARMPAVVASAVAEMTTQGLERMRDLYVDGLAQIQAELDRR